MKPIREAISNLLIDKIEELEERLVRAESTIECMSDESQEIIKTVYNKGVNNG